MEGARWTRTVVALCLGGALGAGAVSAVKAPSREAAAPSAAPLQVVETVLAPRLLRLGTGAVTGAYFPVGGALCQVFNARRTSEGALCAALATGGSKDNLEALRAGGLELALVQSDWHYHALRGSPAFGPDGAIQELRSVLSLYKEPLTLVARREAGVARLADLKGKRLSLGAAGSGARALTDAVLRALGWRSEDLKAALELDPVAQVDALCAGAIDVAAFASGHPNGLIGSAAQGCDAVLVPVVGPEIDRLLADNPFYARAYIPGGLYPGNAEPVESFGVAVTLVARAHLSPDLVEELVEAIAADLEAFQALHPVLAGLAPDALMRDGLSAPAHDGALRAFNARGWK